MAGGSKVHRLSEQSLAFNYVFKPLLSERRHSRCVHQPAGLYYEEDLHRQSLRVDFRYIHGEVHTSCPHNGLPRPRGTEAGPVVVEDVVLLLGGAEEVHAVKPVGLHLPGLNVISNLPFPLFDCEVFACNPVNVPLLTGIHPLLHAGAAVSVQKSFLKSRRLCCEIHI